LKESKKNSLNREVKNQAKNISENHENGNHSAQDRRSIKQKDSYIDANQMFTRCGNHPNILSLFGRLGRSPTSLLSSLRHEACTTPSKMKT
jgi:hypothetical protein